ncbi:hypothetical protein [Acinetobacter towneri]|uniref:hypothetical protein n=1 Tax=Acinetobacter towneri TaxID=202956 RepID=UPI001CE1D9BE|nr:hypothetical protein [Acinetobacter towneri]MCA4791190.1 hypothetical protein [Acinetobacter towneri]
MASWKYLTDQEKREHELYEKKTALDLFFLYLKIQVFLSVVSVFGAYAEYSQYYREINNTHTADFPTGTFFLISLIAPVFLLIFIILMSKYGKSKTTVKLLITLLISLPIVSVVSSLIMATVFKLQVSVVLTQAIGITGLCIFFGIVFAIYSFFSKPFNLQYLNKVKN